jgi:Zn-dependent M28 family amino/carboxypeptidase
MERPGKIAKSAVRIVLAVLVVLALPFPVAWIILAQPTTMMNKRSNKTVAVAKLEEHVRTLCERYHPRDFTHVENLNQCAAYVLDHFKRAGATSATLQTFNVSGKEYKNVIGLFGSPSRKRIVIGAHYDACGPTPGADDNASGIAGLIELGYLLGKDPPQAEVELVAYTLEEPPFFGSSNMGSARHAQSLVEEGVEVKLMIALEMIGYFSDEKGSQEFPFPLLRLFYPNAGDFIALAGRLDQRRVAKKVKGYMKGTTDLAVYSISAPASLPGIDFSDHRNYWKYGYDAVMVTDTAFYRNQRYHTDEDTPDTLDYARMADVVVGVYEAVRKLAMED